MQNTLSFARKNLTWGKVEIVNSDSEIWLVGSSEASFAQKLSLSFSIFFLFLTSLSILNFLSLPLSLSLSFLCIFICFSYQWGTLTNTTLIHTHPWILYLFFSKRHSSLAHALYVCYFIANTLDFSFKHSQCRTLSLSLSLCRFRSRSLSHLCLYFTFALSLWVSNANIISLLISPHKYYFFLFTFPNVELFYLSVYFLSKAHTNFTTISPGHALDYFHVKFQTLLTLKVLGNAYLGRDQTLSRISISSLRIPTQCKGTKYQ